MLAEGLNSVPGIHVVFTTLCNSRSRQTDVLASWVTEDTQDIHTSKTLIYKITHSLAESVGYFLQCVCVCVHACVHVCIRVGGAAAAADQTQDFVPAKLMPYHERAPLPTPMDSCWT